MQGMMRAFQRHPELEGVSVRCPSERFGLKQITALRNAMAPMLLHPALGIAAGETSSASKTPQAAMPWSIYDFHGILLGICTVVTLAVFAAMLYSTIRHRKAAEHPGGQFSRTTALEIVWSLIPCLIVAGIAYPAIRKVEEPAVVALYNVSR